MKNISGLQDNLLRLRAKSGFDSLQAREKWFLIGGLVFIVCFLVVKFAIVPFFTSKNQLEQAIERKQSELVTIRQLQQEYRSLQVREGTIQSRISQRDPQFSLFTFLDSQAEKSGIKKQIKSMKPSVVEGEQNLDEAIVDMKLQKIALNALVDFLLNVESEKFVVFVKRISIQENSAENAYMDVNLQIATFVAKVR